jgi:hypothetical protein
MEVTPDRVIRHYICQYAIGLSFYKTKERKGELLQASLRKISAMSISPLAFI